MQTAAIAAFCITVVLLFMVSSVTLRRSRLSRYELDRRHLSGDQAAGEELDRELVVNDAMSLIRAVTALLLVFVVLFAVGSFDWVFGCLLSVIIALGYGRVAQYKSVHTLANRLYQPYDAQLMTFVRKNLWLGKLIRSISSDTTSHTVSSREELAHVIDQSGHFLSAGEKKLLTSGLHFTEKTVESIMVPRGAIAGLQKTELVGPLMLDELHRTGHSRFPVFDGDIDHVIGVLHIRELLELLDKKSQTAEKAMEKKVYYIHQAQTLGEALAAFIKTRHQLFIVVNENRETVGLLTLEDVVGELIGRKIIDEFDSHSSLNAVAERKSTFKS